MEIVTLWFTFNAHSADASKSEIQKILSRMLWYAHVILINSFSPLLSGLFDILSGLVVVLVHLASLDVLLSSTAFGCKMNLLIDFDNDDVTGTAIIGFYAQESRI